MSMRSPLRRQIITEKLKEKEEIEENSIIQKIVIEKTIEKEEKEESDSVFILYLKVNQITEYNLHY